MIAPDQRLPNALLILWNGLRLLASSPIKLVRNGGIYAGLLAVIWWFFDDAEFSSFYLMLLNALILWCFAFSWHRVVLVGRNADGKVAAPRRHKAETSLRQLASLQLRYALLGACVVGILLGVTGMGAAATKALVSNVVGVHDMHVFYYFLPALLLIMILASRYLPRFALITSLEHPAHRQIMDAPPVGKYEALLNFVRGVNHYPPSLTATWRVGLRLGLALDVLIIAHVGVFTLLGFTPGMVGWETPLNSIHDNVVRCAINVAFVALASSCNAFVFLELMKSEQDFSVFD